MGGGSSTSCVVSFVAQPSESAQAAAAAQPAPAVTLSRASRPSALRLLPVTSMRHGSLQYAAMAARQLPVLLATALLISSQLSPSAAQPPPPQCMYTIAGTGVAGFVSGGPATSSRFFTPRAVARFRDGVLVADNGNSMVRFVNMTSGVMTTVAGTGSASSFSGDGAAATAAELRMPNGVAPYDGGFLIADSDNHAIRFVHGSTGIITTIAGIGGAPGFGGDGGPATAAQLNVPYAIIPNASDIFIADMLNFRIRRVDSSRNIRTIAGNGIAGHSGDGGAATAAMIRRVFALALYAGGLLMADYDANRIRCVHSNGVITTVAGGGAAPGPGPATAALLNGPTGVASDGSASFVMMDQDMHRLLGINASGIISLLAGTTHGYSGDGGLATAAQMKFPCGVTSDGYGGQLISDQNNHAIRYVTPPGMCRPLVNCSVVAPNLICTFSPVAPYLFLNVTLSGAACTRVQAASATTRNVTCPLPSAATGNLTWTLGNVPASMLVANTAYVQPPSCIHTIAGTGTGGGSIGIGASATATQLYYPIGVALYRDGYLIVDQLNSVIRFVNATTGVMTTAAGRVGAGSFSGDGGAATSASLYYPYSVAEYMSGFLIADASNHAIRFVNGSTGVISTIAGRGANLPGDGGPATSAILLFPYAVAGSGSDVIIADTHNLRIRRVDSNRIITTIAGTGTPGCTGEGGAATLAQIGFVYGIAMHAGGLLIADADCSRIRRVDSNGFITSVAGGGSGTGAGIATSIALISPRGVTSDGGSRFIVADTGSSLIRRVDETGYMVTVTGNGSQGYRGDAGFATAAQVNWPSGMALDSYGGLIVADYNNHAIRYVTPPGMCRPLVNCSVAAPNLMCTFSPVAPYLYLSVTLSGTPCTLLQPAPAVSRNVTCTLPPAATGNLVWNLGSVAGSMLVTNTAFVPPLPACMYTVAGTGAAGYSFDGRSATSGRLNYPRAVELHPDGFLVADSGNNILRLVNVSSGTITTVVGIQGSSSYTGNGGPATAASLSNPAGIAAYSGGLLVADSFNNAVRLVDSSRISTIAGSGSSTPGYGGDGEFATAATLNYPCAAVMNGSDVLIADTNNYRIRRVASNRVITTIAGTGTLGYSGDGAAATAANIGQVYGMAMYAHGLLIADANSNRVRRVSSSGIISTVAGGGSVPGPGAATSVALSMPYAVASAGGSSSFVIADARNDRIVLVDGTGYMIILAGSLGGYSGDGGLATAAQMSFPTGQSLDGYGGLLIADYYNHAIRYVTPPGMCRPLVNCSVAAPNLICTFSPVAPYLFLNVTLSGAVCTLVQPATATTRNVTCPLPSAATGNLTWTLGNVPASMLIANTAYVQPPSCMYTIAGTGAAGSSGDGGSATSARLNYPRAVELYRDGFLVADSGNSIVCFVNVSSGVMSTVVGVRGSSSYTGDGGSAADARLSTPAGIAARSGGFLIADFFNHAIRFVNGSTGNISTIAGSGIQGFNGDGGPATAALLSFPHAVVANGSDLLIADSGNCRIRRVDATRTITTMAGSITQGYSGDGGAATSARLGVVYGIAVHSSGLLIADSDASRIRHVSGTGNISTVVGGGASVWPGAATSIALSSPWGVRSDGGSSFIIADSGSSVIRFVDATGDTTIVAGSSVGYSGDGGLATAAQLNKPTGLAYDGYGGLIITDFNNHAIRYVTPPGMCRPLVNCSVVEPNLMCTFSPVAPYLYLNVTLSDAACTMLQTAPAVRRNVSCPLSFGTTATLSWTLGNVAASMVLSLPSVAPTASASVSPTASTTVSLTVTSTQSMTSVATASTTSSCTQSTILSKTVPSTLMPTGSGIELASAQVNVTGATNGTTAPGANTGPISTTPGLPSSFVNGTLLMADAVSSTGVASFQLLTIGACCFGGVLVTLCCAGLCWRARKRYMSGRETWCQEQLQFKHAQEGTTATHSPWVQTISAAFVNAAVPSLTSSRPDKHAQLLSAVHARFAREPLAPAPVVLGACVDIAAEAAHLHANEEAESQARPHEHRSLQASVMLAVSNALEVAEAREAHLPTSSPNEQVPTVARVLQAAETQIANTREDDLERKLASTTAVAQMLTHALAAQDRSISDFMQLIECVVAAGDAYVESPNAFVSHGDSSVVSRGSALAARVVARHNSSSIRAMMKHEHMSAARARAELLRASVTQAFAQAAPLASLPQPVVVSLLTFAVKTTVQKLTVAPTLPTMARPMRVRLLLQNALEAALEELQIADILQCDASASGEVIYKMSTSAIGARASAEAQASASSASLVAATVGAMKARAVQVSTEAKWVITAPSPMPSFGDCVVAEVLSWLQPQQTTAAAKDSSRIAFSPMQVSRKHPMTRSTKVVAAGDDVVAGFNPLRRGSAVGDAHVMASAALLSRRPSRHNVLVASAPVRRVVVTKRAEVMRR